MELSRKVRKVKGFTLTEMLVVMVIIGIIVMIALPKFTSQVTKAKSLEAKNKLRSVYNLQEAHQQEFSKYSNDLVDLGYEQGKLSTEGGNDNYKIYIETADAATFVVKAESVVDFDHDGVNNIWTINQDMELKEEVKD